MTAPSRRPSSARRMMASSLCLAVASVSIFFGPALGVTLGPIERVSVTSSGAQAENNFSGYDDPVLSHDGSVVVFNSYATNLVPGDTNSVHDIFLRDRDASTTTRLSVASNGQQSDYHSLWPSVDATGGLVAFMSAGQLDPALDHNTNTEDVYLRDVSAGTTTLISVNSGGTTAAGGSYPSIDADGTTIAFESCAADLVPVDTNGSCDIFVRDMSLGVTTLVSRDGPGGPQGNGDSLRPQLSADGSTVAFRSCASNFGNDSNGACDVFVRELPNGPLELVSANPSGVAAAGASGSETSTDGRAIDISADGRFVVFLSSATDLLGTQGTPGIYLRDRATATTTRVDLPPDPNSTYNKAGVVAISDNGNLISYVSFRDDLVPGDTNGQADTFLLERTTGEVTRASVTANGGEGNGASYDTAISGDGTVIAFNSLATNLVPGDTNGAMDVFAVDLSSFVPPVAAVSDCSLQQDQSEHPTEIQVLAEQGVSAVKLCAPLAIDISQMGAYAPSGSASATLTPGVIAQDTLVRSYLVHGDRAYPVTKDGDFLYRPKKNDKIDWVTFKLSAGSVLGIIVRDRQLNASDILGASGTAYPAGFAYRGHEVNLLVGGSYINKDDVIYWEDAQTVKLRLQIGEAMDQIRIVTTADAVLDQANLAYLRYVAPPPSLAQDEFDTELCLPGVPPSIKNCNSKDPDPLDDLVVLFEQFDQPLRLAVPLALDIGPGDGTYTLAQWPPSPPAPLPAGTPFRSYIFHADRPGTFDSFPSGDFAYLPSSGIMSFTFDSDILGVITSDARLDASDVAARAGYSYPTGHFARGADFALGAGNANDEFIEIDGRTILIRFHVGNGMDEVRVIISGS